MTGYTVAGSRSVASLFLPLKYSRRARLFQNVTALAPPDRSSCCISDESLVYLRTFGPMLVTAQSTTSFIWAGSL